MEVKSPALLRHYDRQTDQPTNRPNDATDGQNNWSEESFTSNNRALISCMHAYAVSHYLVQKNKGYKKSVKIMKGKKCPDTQHRVTYI